MHIRKLSINDYDAYYKLISQFRETDISEEKYKEIYSSMISDIYVMEDNEELIGTISVILEQKFIFNGCYVAHIEDVCTDKTYRHKGIGSKLLQYVIQEAKNRGCYKVILDCAGEVLQFYKANGFETRGHHCSLLLKEPL